jgi:hypothetical protein
VRLAKEDPEELAGGTVQVLGEPAEQVRLGAAARELYRERFDLPHTVATLLASQSGDRP